MGAVGKTTDEYQTWITNTAKDIVDDTNPNSTFSMGDVEAIAMAYADSHNIWNDDKVIDDLRNEIEKQMAVANGSMTELKTYTVPATFNDGDTPKVIANSDTYTVISANGENTTNYGKLSGTDIKSMLKGYKFDGLFWEHPKKKTLYMLE